MNSTPTIQRPERRTLSVPGKTNTATSKQPAPQPHPLACFVGKRVTIQRGPNTYTGHLSMITNRWLIFKDATIVGSQRTVQVPEVYVAADSISHAHPEVTDTAMVG